MKEFHKKVAEVNADKKNYKLNNIEVSAYASPDGGLKLNTGLAEDREANAEKYLNKQLKKAKIDANVDAKYTAQDWEGFQELVAKSNLQDKDLILRVLSMYQDPEQRENEIKNISSVYKTLADEILPQLRRARLTANYDIIGRSDEEIVEAFDTDPKVLSVEELLYAATLTKDNARKQAIFTKTTQLYPNDYRAYNNLGELAFAAGDAAKAESFFKQALAKNANAAEANAKSYADGLAGNYDSKGSAAQALIDAKAYADGLAGNYDTAGAAAQALTDAKAYSDANLVVAKAYSDANLVTAKTYTDTEVAKIQALTTAEIEAAIASAKAQA
jgi:hypothetical protein